jgi:hypothetical protein
MLLIMQLSPSAHMNEKVTDNNATQAMYDVLEFLERYCKGGT